MIAPIGPNELAGKRNVRRLAVFLAFAVATACGGGGSDPAPPQTGITATFVATNGAPVDGDVTMQPGGGSGATFAVDIAFTGINDVFGATINVTYDPANLRYDGTSFAGTFMTAGVSNPTGPILQASDPALANGTVRIFAGRANPADGGVNVVGTRNLARVTFRALRRFSNSTLVPIDVEVCNSVQDADPSTCAATGPILVNPSGGTVNAN